MLVAFLIVVWVVMFIKWLDNVIKVVDEPSRDDRITAFWEIIRHTAYIAVTLWAYFSLRIN